jgi:hypothetical protein
MEKARSSHDVSYLASPVTGGGFPVGRFLQIFLLGIRQGHKTADDLASFTWKLLESQGQKIVKEGKALEQVDENVAELKSQAQTFLDRSLPILTALHIS